MSEGVCGSTHSGTQKSKVEANSFRRTSHWQFRSLIGIAYQNDKIYVARIQCIKSFEIE